MNKNHAISNNHKIKIVFGGFFYLKPQKSVIC